MHSWIGEQAANHLEIRKIRILVSNETTNYLQSGRAKFLSDYSCEFLDGVTVSAGNIQISAPSAKLQISNKNAGLILFNTIPPITNNFFKMFGLRKNKTRRIENENENINSVGSGGIGSSSVSCSNRDFYINQGRSFLSATNITSANLSFSNAVLVSPNNPTANVFYAVTRLLVLPYQQPGSDFLTRIGMPKTGRNIYKWKAKLPTDTNGVPYAPTGVNANEFTAVLRTNILPALINADANLTKVTNSNFTLSLTSNETRTVNITIDYGDSYVSRRLKPWYLGYTAYSWTLGGLLSRFAIL
jgi:hypothetical protein